MSANEKQIGGDHYDKSGEQHWDRQYRLNGRGYFVGCATGYIERYPFKNGKQDLEKAIHFLQKLIELEYPEEKAEPKKVAPLEKLSNEIEKLSQAITSAPDHLKEFVPTPWQQEVAAKFDDLREKHAISPMLQRFLKETDEPYPNGYVNQD